MTFSRQKLWTFHMTGRGLEEWRPAGILRPEALEAWRHSGTDSSLTAEGLPELHISALDEARRQARRRFHASVRELRSKLQSLLSSEVPAESLTASLGEQAGRFFNAGALAVLHRPVKRTLEADRAARIEKALAVLDRWMEQAAAAPLAWRFTNLDEALAHCREALDGMSAVLRAMRVARLESEARYDAGVHEEYLAALDWRSASDEELFALTPVVVYLKSAAAEFGPALQSGYPLQILVTCEGWHGAELGQIAVAYRSAFVLQSSLADTKHLRTGIQAMAAVLRPAVAVVSTGSPLAASALVESRAFPLFTYDPARGGSWRERFTLREIAQPCDLAAAAAAQSQLQDQFRIVPEEAWTEASVEQASIPYLWVLDSKGVRRRAIFTRELATQIRERGEAFQLLQELAEAGGKRIDEDVAAAREKSAAERGTQDGARMAVERLVAALLSSGPIAAGSPAPRISPASAVAAAVPMAAAAPLPAPPQPAAAAEAGEEPYIDSFLCTSCNDCMKINARVFLYDKNNQAYIGDASAGTYAELVKAAQGCPAKCIHPGSPRPGDTTATPAVIAAAARFR